MTTGIEPLNPTMLISFMGSTMLMMRLITFHEFNNVNDEINCKMPYTINDILSGHQ
jgi:hypothetical protein